MTDTLATKQDLRELEARLDTRLSEMEKRFDTRLSEMEKRFDNRWLEMEKRSDNRFAEMDSHADIRFREVHAQMRGDLADLERRMTLRLGAIVVAMTGIGSAVVKLL